MPKFYAHLAPAEPAKSIEYMTDLFYQLRTGVAGCAEFNKFDLSLIRSWIMQGWIMETEVVIDEAQHASVRAYTHMFYENDLLDIIARSECLAGTQGATTPILACFDEDAGVPIIDEDGKPIGVIMAVVRHTAGQPGEEAAKRILCGQGAFPADVDELFKLYKEENHV